MLSIFRINDISRVIILGLLLALIRLPFWIKGIPVIDTVFEFRLLSEALSEGRLIYSDVWHYSAPLSAWFLQLFGELFGRSFVAFQIFGFVLLLLQAVYFNTILNRLDALKERTLIPSVFYVFYGSLMIEQFAMGPELLAMFPLLLMMSLILEQIRYGAEDEKFFSIGFVFALSVLFNGSLVWLFLFLLLYFPFVFVMNGKRFSLLITGTLFPFISAALYFYLRDGFADFTYYYLRELFIPFYNNYFSLTQYIVIFSIPLILFIISLFQSIFRFRFLNYQVSFNNFFLLLIPFAIPVIFFSKELSIKSFYIVLPIFCLFVSHLYHSLKRRGINELIFNVLLLLLVLMNFGFTYKVFFNPESINIDQLKVTVKTEIKEEKIAVLDENLGYWYENKYSGPFLFQPYTERYFKEKLNFEKITTLHDHFMKEAPTIVIDPNDYFERYRSKDLEIFQSYMKIGPSEFIVEKKD